LSDYDPAGRPGGAVSVSEERSKTPIKKKYGTKSEKCPFKAAKKGKGNTSTGGLSI